MDLPVSRAPCVLVPDCPVMREQANAIAPLLPARLVRGKQGDWSPYRPHPNTICDKIGVCQAQEL